MVSWTKVRSEGKAIPGVSFRATRMAERGDMAGGYREAVSAMRGTALRMSREERILPPQRATRR